MTIVQTLHFGFDIGNLHNIDSPLEKRSCRVARTPADDSPLMMMYVCLRSDIEQHPVKAVVARAPVQLFLTEPFCHGMIGLLQTVKTYHNPYH